MAASTVDDFVLPPGDTFPPQHPGMISMDRPRRKSIDTPVLKLDTSVVISVTERIDVNDFPPPPKRKADASKVEEKSNQSPAKNKAQKSIKNQNDVQKEDETPVMQSMFPRFDARLSQQSIPLAVERNPPKTTGTHCSPSLYSRPSSPPLAVIARDPRVTSRLSSTFFQQFPQRSEEQPSNIATPAQLSDLWNIAIGKDSPEALPTYNLALKCNSLRRNHESIDLTSDTIDLYTINVSGPTIAITRKHPLDPSIVITITTPMFEVPTTTSPILATLFPTVSELEAYGAAQQIATENQLSLQDSTKLAVQAIEQAKHLEAGFLLWDSDSLRYYFSIPFLKSQPATNSQTKALPIEYTPDESIRFLDGSSQSLLTLNLIDHTLTLDTSNIVNLSSSQHTLDILISALLILSIHLHRTDDLLTEPTIIVPHFDPPPKSTSKTRRQSSIPLRTLKRKQTQSSQKPSQWLSRLNPLSRTQSHLSHPPRNTSTSTNTSTLAFDKDIETGHPIIRPHHIPPMTTAPIPTSGIAPELRASNTGVDLSKFQAFDLEDPELGRGTKAMLRLVYWAFSVMVWVLGVFVGVLAAGVVAAGGCLGGGKGSREG